MNKDIVIVFEDDLQEIIIKDDKIEFDISNEINVINSAIQNQDETLDIETVGLVTNINTNIVNRYDNHYEFPNRGIEKAIYIDLENKEIYMWYKSEYVKLTNNFENIKIINGGNAR